MERRSCVGVVLFFFSSRRRHTRLCQVTGVQTCALPIWEKSAVLRGPDVWCVPVAALRHTLGQLADAGADAPRREARNIVLNYARRIDHADASARRSVAAGLNELSSIIESLWPNQLPEDLSRGAMKAMDTEKSPET